jgi:hypothetical protein
MNNLARGVSAASVAVLIAGCGRPPPDRVAAPGAPPAAASAPAPPSPTPGQPGQVMTNEDMERLRQERAGMINRPSPLGEEGRGAPSR